MAEYVSYKKEKTHNMFKFGKYSFSTTELKHLGGALVLITLAMMALQRDMFFVLGPLVFITLYFFTIGLGFLLHELGHKLVAQYYGFISEFRADFKMMFVSIIIAYFGFLFLAPGAVMILARPTIKQNGIISVAGPIVNLVLAIIFLGLDLILSPADGTLLSILFSLGVWVNAFLGVFNMLPIWVLDGKKVLAWSKPVYFTVMGLLLVLLLRSFGVFFI